MPRAAESQEGGAGERRYRFPRVKMWIGKVADTAEVTGGNTIREVRRTDGKYVVKSEDEGSKLFIQKMS